MPQCWKSHVAAHFWFNPQVAQLQMKVYRALSQESLGGAYAQEALSRLDSDLLDITKVCMLL